MMQLSAVRRLGARTPLRIKLVAALLALLTLGLTGAGLAARAALQSYLLSRVDSQLARAASFAVLPLSSGYPFQCRDGTGRVDAPSPVYLQLADTRGNTLGACPVSGQNPPDLPKLSLQDAQARAGDAFTVPSVGSGHNWRVRVAVISGAGTLFAASSLSEVDSTIDHLVAVELIGGLGALLIFGALGYVVVRRSLRPLVQVEHTAEQIAAGDLSLRVPTDPDPRTEVGRLSAALNTMLSQIETAFRARQESEAAALASEERMRRFVADASHELRTPLTSIRGFAELYRQGAAPDPADIDRAMHRIEDQARRMGILVEDLLLLARLDQQRPLERSAVDLVTLAADAKQDAEAIDPVRRISLEVEAGQDPPIVLGDDTRLRQVVGNLMSNALVHTPPGTAISIRVGTTSDGMGALDVADRGPGLSVEDAAHVFERFYRADPSRTRAAGGSGLGLSIAAALVAAQMGTLTVDTAPGEGATFRIRLPLA
jgi:two-component system, OmpR family, sensor kinase